MTTNTILKIIALILIFIPNLFIFAAWQSGEFQALHYLIRRVIIGIWVQVVALMIIAIFSGK